MWIDCFLLFHSEKCFLTLVFFPLCPQKANAVAVGSGNGAVRAKEKVRDIRQTPLHEGGTGSLPELEGLAHRMEVGQPGGVLVVSKRPERHEYGSVCEAVRWARAGSVIEVLDGIYQEEILIEKVCCSRHFFFCVYQMIPLDVHVNGHV